MTLNKLSWKHNSCLHWLEPHLNSLILSLTGLAGLGRSKAQLFDRSGFSFRPSGTLSAASKPEHTIHTDVCWKTLLRTLPGGKMRRRWKRRQTERHKFYGDIRRSPVESRLFESNGDKKTLNSAAFKAEMYLISNNCWDLQPSGEVKTREQRLILNYFHIWMQTSIRSNKAYILTAVCSISLSL